MRGKNLLYRIYRIQWDPCIKKRSPGYGQKKIHKKCQNIALFNFLLIKNNNSAFALVKKRKSTFYKILFIFMPEF